MDLESILCSGIPQIAYQEAIRSPDNDGGEPENYEIIHETELRPIINVEPTYESVYHELEELVLHPERIPELKRQSIEYITRHHDYIKVARRYIDFWDNNS